MIFTETKIVGAFLTEIERRTDARGFFARAWCSEKFAALGLNTSFAQANIAFTEQSGTLRGLHFQAAPHAEAKLVRCTRGAICDVIVDLRPESPSYRQWVGQQLTVENHYMLYIPEGCAHGYQTLLDDTEVFYLVSQPYAPGAEQGIRFDDPAFRIQWPIEIRSISEKDRNWTDYDASRSQHPECAK